MAKPNIKVTLKKHDVMMKVQTASKKALPIVTTEFLKDANAYAREDTGELIRSSIKASELEKGIVRWRTPYARIVYYTGTPVREKNRGADLMWAHKADAENRKRYQKLLQELIEGKRNVR